MATATVTRIALIADTAKGPRARYVLPDTDEGRARAEALASANGWTVTEISNQPK